MNVLRHFVKRFYSNQQGQTLVLMAVMMTALLCIAGFAIDVGRCYYTYRQLQASTDAAALAGASQLPGSTADATANAYSAIAGAKNTLPSIAAATMVSGYPKVECLSTLQNQGMACVAPANGNAVAVKEQVSLPLYFLKLLGRSTQVIAASSTASMRGSNSTPYNVVIVVDSTASMNDYDSDSNCTSTRLTCALSGVQVLLSSLSPCGTGLSACGAVSSGNVTNPVDTVSVFTFPAVNNATSASAEYDCNTKTNPTIAAYNSAAPATYEIVPFSSDYRSSDTSTSLSVTSNLVTLVGGKSGCAGLQAPGGAGTYYAGVIYSAQQALITQQLLNPGTQNVMILLSDGDASSSNITGASSSKTAGVYPSIYNQCAQAVAAAQQATAAGTHVYSVAYGATSSGCSTDSPTITPCQVMQQIASAPQYFFSDYTASAGSGNCISASQPTSNLNQIFTQIAGDLTTGRLIPDNTP